VPVTPRPGYPVEINALWYHAWRVRASFARRLKRSDEAARASSSADRIRDAFAARFWEPARGYLADRVDNLGADPALLPNQLYEIAYGVVDGVIALASLEAVERAPPRRSAARAVRLTTAERTLAIARATRAITTDGLAVSLRR
jgi:glycogen debranching enzyme